MASPWREELYERALSTVVDGRIEVVLGQLDGGGLCAGHRTGGDGNGHKC